VNRVTIKTDPHGTPFFGWWRAEMALPRWTQKLQPRRRLDRNSGSKSLMFNLWRMIGYHIAKLCNTPFPNQRRPWQGVGWHIMEEIWICSSKLSVALESTLGIWKVICAFQDLDKSVVYHMFHGITNPASHTGRPVTSCEGTIPTEFQVGDNCSLSPGRWGDLSDVYNV
jgi:hypothetical protein